MPGDDVEYQASSVDLFFQVKIFKDVWDIPVWNLAPSPVPGVVQYICVHFIIFVTILFNFKNIFFYFENVWLTKSAQVSFLIVLSYSFLNYLFRIPSRNLSHPEIKSFAL